MPRDMVADPFMSAGEARVLQAKEAGFEPHNLSESQLVIMQQPEDLVAKRAAAAAHLALYGDDHMSSDQIQKATGEGDIFAASPAPLGVRKKDPSAAGGPSSLEVAKASSRKKTGACAVNLADINDETRLGIGLDPNPAPDRNRNRNPNRKPPSPAPNPDRNPTQASVTGTATWR